MNLKPVFDGGSLNESFQAELTFAVIMPSERDFKQMLRVPLSAVAILSCDSQKQIGHVVDGNRYVVVFEVTSSYSHNVVLYFALVSTSMDGSNGRVDVNKLCFTSLPSHTAQEMRKLQQAVISLFAFHRRVV